MTAPLLQDVEAPLFLRNLRGWLVWRYEHSENAKKPLKIPYYTNGQKRHHKHGSPEDIALLVDFASAKQFAIDNGFTGLGIAFRPEFGITGVDFDDCVDESGDINPDVERTIIGTYAEYSPSGTGIHAFVLGSNRNNKHNAKDGNWGIELFHSKGFLTFTGHVTDLTELTDSVNSISEPTAPLSELIMARFGAVQSDITTQVVQPIGLTHEQLAHALNYIQVDDLSYPEWLRLAMAIHHETEASEDGFILLDSWSSNHKYYQSEEYIRSKWESFSNSDKPVTARSLLKQANASGAGIITERASSDDFEPITSSELYPPNTSPSLSESLDPAPLSTHFHIRSDAEFCKTITPISWLIKGFLPKATLGVLYGESGSGKSFVALDICASLVRQLDWNGLRSRKESCRVLYVAAEGVGGFAHRLAAYRHKAGLGQAHIGFDIISDVAPNLMDGISVNHLIQDIEEMGRYDLIVMDTFAQVTPGANENSGEDMGRALGYCRKISQCSNAMVLLIHHSGKDASKGARGWSGVHAASDVVFEVTRFDNERCIKVTKQKDGIDGKEFGFSLLPVILGEDEDGDDISSCVVDYHPFVKPVKIPELKTNQKLVYNVLLEFNPESWVAIDHLIDLCLERMPKEEGVRDTRKQMIKKSVSGGIDVFLETNGTGEYRAKRK